MTDREVLEARDIDSDVTSMAWICTRPTAGAASGDPAARGIFLSPDTQVKLLYPRGKLSCTELLGIGVVGIVCVNRIC